MPRFLQDVANYNRKKTPGCPGTRIARNAHSQAVHHASLPLQRDAGRAFALGAETDMLLKDKARRQVAGLRPYFAAGNPSLISPATRYHVS